MPEVTPEIVERFYGVLAILAIAVMAVIAGLRFLAIGSDGAPHRCLDGN